MLGTGDQAVKRYRWQSVRCRDVIHIERYTYIGQPLFQLCLCGTFRHDHTLLQVQQLHLRLVCHWSRINTMLTDWRIEGSVPNQYFHQPRSVKKRTRRVLESSALPSHNTTFRDCMRCHWSSPNNDLYGLWGVPSSSIISSSDILHTTNCLGESHWKRASVRCCCPVDNVNLQNPKNHTNNCNMWPHKYYIIIMVSHL